MRQIKLDCFYGVYFKFLTYSHIRLSAQDLKIFHLKYSSTKHYKEAETGLERSKIISKRFSPSLSRR